MFNQGALRAKEASDGDRVNALAGRTGHPRAAGETGPRAWAKEVTKNMAKGKDLGCSEVKVRSAMLYQLPKASGFMFKNLVNHRLVPK